MKYIMLFTLLTSLFSASAFAVGQTNTDCPMMRESESRSNPKQNMSKDSKKEIRKGGVKAAGA
jgi:hypothetical protein